MNTLSRPSLAELGILVLLAFSPLLCLSIADALSGANNDVFSAIQVVSIASVLLPTFVGGARNWLNKKLCSLKSWYIVLTLISSALLLAGASRYTLVEPWQTISFISIILGLFLLGLVIVNVLWKQVF